MSKSATGAIVDIPLDDFKKEMFNRPIGECLSMRNFLHLEYERVKGVFDELTNKAIREGKQKDPEYVNTLKGVNVVMFNIEQKVLFLNDRIEDLRIV